MSISTASSAISSRFSVIVALAAIESDDVSTEVQPFGVVFSMSISYAIKQRMSTTILHLFLELLAAADGRFGDW